MGMPLHFRIMMRKAVAILCLLAVCTIVLDVSYAQGKRIGVSFSYAGAGLDFAFDVDEENFAEFQLRMDTMEMFRISAALPGISASAFWNIIFAKLESRNGNSVRLYAGPGLSLGYTGDIQCRHGLIFGVRGRVGGECAFPRGISVAMNISPMVGGHFGMRDNMINMRLYKNGLLQILTPEVSIRYRF